MRSSTGEARWRDGEMPRRGRDVDATAVPSPQVLALDTDGEPLRPALLWMDSRAAPQAYVLRERCLPRSQSRRNLSAMGAHLP